MVDKQIIIFDGNLFFQSAISGQLEKRGIKSVSLLSQAELKPELLNSTALAIVNLNATRFDPLAAIGLLNQSTSIKILGFCGHGQADLMEKGKAAGCDWVVPNSVVTKSLIKYLQKQGLFSFQSESSTKTLTDIGRGGIISRP